MEGVHPLTAAAATAEMPRLALELSVVKGTDVHDDRAPALAEQRRLDGDAVELGLGEVIAAGLGRSDTSPRRVRRSRRAGGETGAGDRRGVRLCMTSAVVTALLRQPQGDRRTDGSTAII